MAQAPTPKVFINAVNPEPAEIIAASIIEIAKGMRVLNNSRLTRKASQLAGLDYLGFNKADYARRGSWVPKKVWVHTSLQGMG